MLLPFRNEKFILFPLSYPIYFHVLKATYYQCCRSFGLALLVLLLPTITFTLLRKFSSNNFTLD